MGDIVPSIRDGLKESERILLFCALKKHGFSEVNVEQLAKDTNAFWPRKQSKLAYWVAAIYRMARDFPGANNINIFQPVGHFGSRYGNVSPSPDGTDLMVKLNPAARKLFHEDDDVLAMELSSGCEKCGKVPVFLLPIIPLILVNGTDCSVSKYRSYVPTYEPLDIIANLRRLLRKEDMKPMIPWFKGFKGSVNTCKDDDAKFIITGAIDNIDFDSKTVHVTELPIGVRARDYIKLLEDGSVPNKGFVDYSDDINNFLCLRVSLLDEDCKMDVQHLLERLKLTKIISLDEMYLLDATGQFKKYNSPLEVIYEFYDCRIHFYDRRLEFIMNDVSQQIRVLDNEIGKSCSIAKQCLIVIMVSTGRLPNGLTDFLDEFILQNLVIELINQDENIDVCDEAVEVFTTLSNKIVTCQNLSFVDDDKSLRMMNIAGQSTSGDMFVLLKVAESQIKRLITVLQDIKKFQSSRLALSQKLDNLKAADAFSLWLDDLCQLEKYFAGQDLCSLEAKQIREADMHLTGEGKKRKGPSLDNDRFGKRVAYYAGGNNLCLL